MQAEKREPAIDDSGSVPTDPPAPADVREGPFETLRHDLQRSRIVCNTLDALFRRSEGLCLAAEAEGLYAFVEDDLRRIYANWSEDVIPLIQGSSLAGREGASLIATLHGELNPLEAMAEGLGEALQVYCEEPSEPAKAVIADRLARFCPTHRGLIDWLQASVLARLHHWFDTSARQSLAIALDRRTTGEAGCP